MAKGPTTKGVIVAVHPETTDGAEEAGRASP
jgi:hypothetical protein